MEVRIFDDKNTLGKEAAAKGATYIRKAIAKNGHANVTLNIPLSQDPYRHDNDDRLQTR